MRVAAARHNGDDGTAGAREAIVDKASGNQRPKISGVPRADVWGYLPSAGFFFVMMLTLDYPFVLAGALGSAQAAGLFVVGVVGATVVLGACAAFAGMLGAVATPSPWVVPGAALALGGLLGAVLLAGDSWGTYVVCGALSGAGLLTVGLIWGERYARLRDMSALLVCVATALGIAALAEWVVQFALPLERAWIYVVACAVGLLVCALGAMARSQESACDKPCMVVERPGVDGLRMRSLLADLWPLLCGLGLVFAIVGFTWGDCLFGARGTEQMGVQGIQTPFERPFFVALLMVVALVYAARTDSISLNLVFQILPLVAAALSLITWLLPMEDVGIAVQTYKSFSRAAGFAVFGVGTWLYVCTAISERNLASNVVLGLCTAFEALVLLVCSLFVDVFSQEMAAAITPCLTVIYLLAVAVFEILENAEHPSSAVVDGVGDACGRVAAEFGLSPRETDVLGYLARGRSATFIADELRISPHTVKTHIKRIHEKLGLGSKEEIISLVESQG